MLEDSLREHFADLANTIATPDAERRVLAGVAERERSSERSGRRFSAVKPLLTAACVLLVVAGTAFGLGRRTAPSEPAGLATSSSSSPAATVRTAPITPQYVVGTAISLLPKGGHESELSGSASTGLVSGNLRYTAGAASSYLVVEIAYPITSSRQDSSPSCTSPSGLPSNAERTPRNDGSTMVVIPNAQSWLEVYLCRADGVRVAVVEKAYEHSATTTLDAADLAAIVTSDRWQTRVPAADVANSAQLFPLAMSSSSAGSRRPK